MQNVSLAQSIELLLNFNKQWHIMSELILDRIYSHTLARQIIEEGLLPAENPDTHIPPEEKFLQPTLQAMLMYGDALSFTEGLNLNANRLNELGVLELGELAPNSLPIFDEETLRSINQEAFYSEIRQLTPFVSLFIQQYLEEYLNSGSKGPVLLDYLCNFSPDKLGSKKMRLIAEQLPELIFQYALGDQKNWDNIHAKGFSEEAIDFVNMVGIVDSEQFVNLTIAINEPKKLIAESQQRTLPIFGSMLRCPSGSLREPVDQAESAISVMEIVTSELGYELPIIKSVTELLELSNDDRVISLRAEVKNVAKELSKGNLEIIPQLSKKVEKAGQELALVSERRDRIKWAFMIPVATGLLETVIGLFPIVSTIISLGLAGGDHVLKKKEEANQWTWLLSKQ